jgi:serine protease Do
MANDQVARLPFTYRGAAHLGLILAMTLAAWPENGSASELRKTPIVTAVEAAGPSVVNIRGEKTVGGTTGSQPGQADGGRRVNGMGTGVVIDPRGYIITNYHVVEGVRQIQITMADGRQYTARLVSRDPETDLAIIKIDAPEPLPVINIGRSNDLMPGETVVAVGNAYGYQDTITRGIISALHRAVQVSDAQYYEDLIQTDASINPGNSGGPLLNIDGQMIGINVAVRAGAQGIGFAIPVDKAMAVLGKLLAECSTVQAYHGIHFETDPAEPLDGAVVKSVDDGSPAALLDLKPGDVITGIGDVPVTRSSDFHRAMLDRRDGEQIELSIRRGDEFLAFELELAKVGPKLQEPDNETWNVLGMELQPISSEDFRQRFRSSLYDGGLTVKSLRSGGPASSQGVQVGDVLVGVHIWQTVSLENVSYIIHRPNFASFTPLRFLIIRDGKTYEGHLPLPVRTAQR